MAAKIIMQRRKWRLGDMVSDSDHDAWVRQQIQQTLDKKARGEMTYYSFDQVADELGFNVR